MLPCEHDSPAPQRVRIAALLASFNRCGDTLSCLANLEQQELPANVVIDVYLVDDASTDGTAEAVSQQFPAVKLIQGTGSLYWGGGMRAAYAAAVTSDYDYYLWMNDDITLKPDAIASLYSSCVTEATRRDQEPIMIGVFSEPGSIGVSYGGWVSTSRIFPTRMRRLESSGDVQECHAGNGNCVLIPRKAAAQVGDIDPKFVHRLGDFDYTLRARALGISVLTVPDPIGTCRSNLGMPEQLEVAPSIAEQWRIRTSLKGLPVDDWRIYSRRHGGLLWPVSFLSPYVRFWWNALGRVFRQPTRIA